MLFEVNGSSETDGDRELCDINFCVQYDVDT